MCDYSVHAARTRDAKVGDRLITNLARPAPGDPVVTLSVSFCDMDDPGCAVCLKPGTELAFDGPIRTNGGFCNRPSAALDASVARFFQKDADDLYNPAMVHKDGIELADGRQVMLYTLDHNQTARVLQLPAEPVQKAWSQPKVVELT